MPDVLRVVPQREPDRSHHFSLLLIEDQQASCAVCRQVAEACGFNVRVAENESGAQALLAAQPADVVLMDLPHAGADLLAKLKAGYPETEVIVCGANASVQSVLGAIKHGAFDYLPKPFHAEELRIMLQRVAAHLQNSAEERVARRQLMDNPGYAGLVGQSAEMQKLYRIIAKVATSRHPVFILGESGTGRERMARSIHSSGPFADRPFEAIDCSAHAAIVEGDLFGFCKSAPAAGKPKSSAYVLASGGTVFLDEIGELPLDLQGKLMRVLQEKEIRTTAALKPVPLDVRVIASTHRDLEACIQQGTFRRDLFFRLNVVSLRVPPLRDRKDDIRLLADYILTQASSAKGVEYALGPQAMKALVKYDWPGNVRELENCLERAVAASQGRIVNIQDLPPQIQSSVAPARLEVASGERPKIVPLAEVEKQAILETLERLNGDKLMTARLLGIGKTTLYRKLKEYGIRDEWLARPVVNKQVVNK